MPVTDKDFNDALTELRKLLATASGNDPNLRIVVDWAGPSLDNIEKALSLQPGAAVDKALLDQRQDQEELHARIAFTELLEIGRRAAQR